LRGKISGLRAARQIRGEGFGSQEEQLRAIFDASERTIFDVGQQTGFDWYWRAYFWLLRR
jgi:hypothetical protein